MGPRTRISEAMNSLTLSGIRQQVLWGLAWADADGCRVNYGATNYLSLRSTVAVGSHYDSRPPEGAVIRQKAMKE